VREEKRSCLGGSQRKNRAPFWGERPSWAFQSCDVLYLESSKLPFFVGAGGFEPPASWSRKKQLPPNPAKIGHYSQNLVHQVHRVTQFHYSLVTVPVALHPCSYGRQSPRHEDDGGVSCILHEVRIAGRFPPGVLQVFSTSLQSSLKFNEVKAACASRQTPPPSTGRSILRWRDSFRQTAPHDILLPAPSAQVPPLAGRVYCRRSG